MLPLYDFKCALTYLFLKSDLRMLKDLSHKEEVLEKLVPLKTDEDERFSHSVHVFRL